MFLWTPSKLGGVVVLDDCLHDSYLAASFAALPVVAQELLSKTVESGCVGVLIATHVTTTCPLIAVSPTRLLKKGCRERRTLFCFSCEMANAINVN